MTQRHKNILKYVTLSILILLISLGFNTTTVHADYNGDGTNAGAEINSAKVKGQYPSYCKTGYLVYVVHGPSSSIASPKVIYVNCGSSKLDLSKYDTTYLTTRIGNRKPDQFTVGAPWGYPFDTNGNTRENQIETYIKNSTNQNKILTMLGMSANNIPKSQWEDYYIILENCTYHKLFTGTWVGKYILASSSGIGRMGAQTHMKTTGDGHTGWMDNWRLQVCEQLDKQWPGLPAPANVSGRVDFNTISNFGTGLIAVNVGAIDGEEYDANFVIRQSQITKMANFRKPDKQGKLKKISDYKPTISRSAHTTKCGGHKYCDVDHPCSDVGCTTKDCTAVHNCGVCKTDYCSPKDQFKLDTGKVAFRLNNDNKDNYALMIFHNRDEWENVTNSEDKNFGERVIKSGSGVSSKDNTWYTMTATENTDAKSNEYDLWNYYCTIHRGRDKVTVLSYKNYPNAKADLCENSDSKYPWANAPAGSRYGGTEYTTDDTDGAPAVVTFSLTDNDYTKFEFTASAHGGHTKTQKLKLGSSYNGEFTNQVFCYSGDTSVTRSSQVKDTGTSTTMSDEEVKQMLKEYFGFTDKKFEKAKYDTPEERLATLIKLLNAEDDNDLEVTDKNVKGACIQKSSNYSSDLKNFKERSGRQVTTAPFNFLSYYTMRYDAGAIKNRLAYVVSEHTSTFKCYDFAEVYWVNDENKNQLILDTNQWSTHQTAVKRWGKGTALPGGAALSINIPKDKQQDLVIVTMQAILPDETAGYIQWLKTNGEDANKLPVSLRFNPDSPKSSTAVEEHTKYVQSVINTVEALGVQQWVSPKLYEVNETKDTSSEARDVLVNGKDLWNNNNAIKVDKGTNIEDLNHGISNQKASSDDKYYFTDEIYKRNGDNWEKSETANKTPAQEGDLDVAIRKLKNNGKFDSGNDGLINNEGDISNVIVNNTKRTYYTVYATQNGQIKMCDGLIEAGDAPGPDTNANTRDAIEDRTQVMQALADTLEQGAQGEGTSYDDEAPTVDSNVFPTAQWYNEVFDGVVIIVQETRIHLGYIDPYTRTSILDPTLCPTTEGKSDMFSKGFVTQLSMKDYSSYWVNMPSDNPDMPLDLNNGNDITDLIGVFKNSAVYLEENTMREMYKSRKFIIPNVNVQDLH